MTFPIQTKVCSVCHREMPLCAFYIHTSGSLYCWCIPCHNAKMKEYRKTHKTKYNQSCREYQNKYRKLHPEKIKVYRKRYYLKHREEILAKRKETYDRSKKRDSSEH